MNAVPVFTILDDPPEPPKDRVILVESTPLAHDFALLRRMLERMAALYGQATMTMIDEAHMEKWVDAIPVPTYEDSKPIAKADWASLNTARNGRPRRW